MALKTFEHVLILADDVDKTKDFYVDILGLNIGYRPDFPFKGYWLYLDENPKAACIHLAMRKQDTGQDYYIGKKDDVKSGSGAIDHVAFNADDIESMKAKLEKISIEYTHRKVPGFPLEQLFIMDPDGVKVELNYATSE
jgi:catechol 2,3-dioxygenase-like lactoylglutathione lyase family enzyme|tara:strand:+ start:368 stop:784 length:417 start_codon:yes stop_codon:yes gene_type:complete